jgi:hypothetical protein
LARPLRLAGLVCGLVVSLPLLCRSARAATTIVYDMPDGITRTYTHDGARVRLQNPEGSYPDSALVFDLQAKRAYIVYDDVKRYIDVYRRLRENRKRLAPLRKAAQRAVARAAAEKVRFEPMGEARTIGGFSCGMYRRLVDGRAVEEICAAPWGPTVAGPDDADWMRTAMGQWMEVVFGPISLPRAKDDERWPGFPISRRDVHEDGSVGAEARVVSIKLDPVPASLFTVPADYREVDHQLTGPGSSGMPRVAAEPAPASTSESPRAGTSRRPASGLSLILVLGVLVVATIGLTIHAALLHLAAVMVLERPRFLSALVAAMIVWVMALPLKLLEVWLPLAAGVELLAAFGSLKIAYGASNRRTLALFVVSAIIVGVLGGGLGLLKHLSP